MKVFPSVSNQIRYQKKRLLNISGPMLNPIISSGNSFSNLNSIDPYSSSHNAINPPMQTINPPLQSLSNVNTNNVNANNFQTEDIFAMLDKLNEKKENMLIEP
jgi:hypothetical protein